MQTRYYNPSYGRFLNADTTEILERTKGTVLGANIFAYCNNNPVMNVDYTGEISGPFILFILLTILVVLGFSVVLPLLRNQYDKLNDEDKEKVRANEEVYEMLYGKN